MSPLLLNFLGSSKDGDVGNGDFGVPVKFTMVPNQLWPFFPQNFLVYVESYFQLEKMIKFTPKKNKQH
jgi:hypothetical protein